MASKKKKKFTNVPKIAKCIREKKIVSFGIDYFKEKRLYITISPIIIIDFISIVIKCDEYFLHFSIKICTSYYIISKNICVIQGYDWRSQDAG